MAHQINPRLNLDKRYPGISPRVPEVSATTPNQLEGFRFASDEAAAAAAGLSAAELSGIIPSGKGNRLTVKDVRSARAPKDVVVSD